MRISVVRFDPQYIPGEDAPVTASGEIDLPDDLLELGAQLRDDAAYLAERYPAAGVQALACETKQKRSLKAGLQRLAALGYVAAALLIAVAVSPMFWSESQPPDNVPVAASPSVTSVPVAAADIISDPPAVSGGSRTVRLPWAPRPAIGEVTGPELEGLLDLWQNDEKPAETRISI
jgi:hypothetical protein